MPETITTSISMPKALEKELQKEAKAEHRTKSGLIQEAIRYYLENKKWKQLQKDIAFRAAHVGISSEEDIENLIDEARR